MKLTHLKTIDFTYMLESLLNSLKSIQVHNISVQGQQKDGTPCLHIL